MPKNLNELLRDPLGDRWTPLRPHPEQTRLLRSKARFRVVPAGRRSGKTERAKRWVVRQALDVRTFNFPDPQFGCCAPTYQQAKNIYWKDLKKLVPKWALAGTPSETELSIPLITGAVIRVIGMDKPARIEGTPWDGLVLDEYANMKKEAWEAHALPALTDRKGWAWLIGVPEGRNHYYDTYMSSLGPWNVTRGGDWDGFTWKSIDIMDPEEINMRRQQMDPLTFQQEYEASFINFAGQAYYQFERDTHVDNLRQRYNPKGTIGFCLDFNVDPGTATIVQEIELPSRDIDDPGIEVHGRRLFANSSNETVTGTAVIGEVWIPRNSNTPAVCRKLAEDWKDHEGRIEVYGDATGGARTTSSETGNSDWDLVKENLYRDFGAQRVKMMVPDSNPRERERVNAMNSRLKTDSGTIRMMVDGSCVETIKDFEGVRLLEGGSGELDKKHDRERTHLTDGLGYYVAKRFPIRREQAEVTELRR